FTSSTSFANPAVTIARGLSDTFAGINPAHIPMFIVMQIVGVGVSALILPRLFPKTS
ncbi:MAG: aquaporin, partial [Paracoccaceae bacterium]|nr:aquaporin [Paracoccaceae bacterium]